MNIVDAQLAKAKRFGHEIFSIEIAADHGYLFVQADPSYSPGEVAK